MNALPQDYRPSALAVIIRLSERMSSQGNHCDAELLQQIIYLPLDSADAHHVYGMALCAMDYNLVWPEDAKFVFPYTRLLSANSYMAMRSIFQRAFRKKQFSLLAPDGGVMPNKDTHVCTYVDTISPSIDGTWGRTNITISPIATRDDTSR